MASWVRRSVVGSEAEEAKMEEDDVERRENSGRAKRTWGREVGEFRFH